MRNSEQLQAQWKARIETRKKEACLGPDLRKLNGLPHQTTAYSPKIAEPITGPLDMDPLIGGTILRRRKNRPPAKKRIVSQIRFDEHGEMAKRLPQVANAKGILKDPTPIETVTNIKREDQTNPDATATEARNQYFAIEDNIARRKQK